MAGKAHLGGLPNGVIAEGVLASCYFDLAAATPEARMVISRDDSEKAFPKASRSNILTQLQADERTRDNTAPAFAWTASHVQRMVYPRQNNNPVIFNQVGGITMGAIDGTKLYSIGTTQLVQGLQDIGGDRAVVTAIVDDITVHGTIDAVWEMEQLREELQAPSNYVVNKLKQRIYVAHQQHADEVLRLLPNHKVTLLEGDGGVTIGGTPIGGDAYCHRAMQGYIEETRKAIQSIMTLTSRQEQLLMLRSCIPGRITHLVSVLPPGLTREYAEQHDQMLHSALKDIMGIDGQFTLREKLQLQRKLSSHGFGFRSISFNLNFLFLDGFAKSVRCLSHWKAATEAINHAAQGEGTYGAALFYALEELKALALERDDQSLMQLLPDTINQLVMQQFNWQHKKIQQRMDNIIEKQHEAEYNPLDKDEEREKAIMQSTDHAVFHLCPRDQTLTLSNEELQHSARHALGRKTKKQRAQCGNFYRNGQRCLETLDAHDVHISICKARPPSHQRHQSIQDWLKAVANQAGMATEEAPILPGEQGNSYKKADLLIKGASLGENANIDGGSCIVDVTCVTAAAESHIKTAFSDGAKPLKEVEDKKSEKYEASYRKYEPTRGATFTPFAVSSTGIIGKKGRELLGRLCEIIARFTGQDRSVIQYHWKARLLTILAKHRFELTSRHAAAQQTKTSVPGEVDNILDFNDIPMHEIKRIQHGGLSGKISF